MIMTEDILVNFSACDKVNSDYVEKAVDRA